MNINDNNYELWLLRYAEQELTRTERAEVEQWLASHPGAAEELALYNEAPRLERNKEVAYGATSLQHTTPMWGAALRWAAAAAVVLALMIPALRTNTSSPAPRLIADNNATPEPQESMEPAEPMEILEPAVNPRKKATIIAKADIAQPFTQQSIETPAPIEQTEPIVSLDSLVHIEQPLPQYVDNLIVYEDEPVTADPVTEVTYITSTDDGITPVALFIGVFLKTTR